MISCGVSGIWGEKKYIKEWGFRMSMTSDEQIDIVKAFSEGKKITAKSTGMCIIIVTLMFSILRNTLIK